MNFQKIIADAKAECGVTATVKEDCVVLRNPEVPQRCAVMRKYGPNSSAGGWYCSYLYVGEVIDRVIGKKAQVANWGIDRIINGAP